jgi:hypothetical protein
MWLTNMGIPKRGHLRPYVWPWFGGDEYYRKTLAIPVGFHVLVIALWEFRDLRECDDCNPYQSTCHQDRVWRRWKQVRKHGRIER